LNWKELLRPSLLKVVLTLVIPAVVSLLVTRRTESILDFYWYLLTPIVNHFDGANFTKVFNAYVLLWLPFYLAACAVSEGIARMVTPRPGE
jgi:hypothetical protein